MNIKFREAVQMVRREGAEALIAAVIVENERIRDSWRAGFLSDDQVMEALTFEEPVHALMFAKHWSFSPTHDCQDDWMRSDRHERMLAEMELWRSGRLAESSVGQPWLFRWRPWPHRHVYRTGRDEPLGEASPEDKALLFRMMDVTFTPASIFETYPEGMALPNAWYDTCGQEWQINIHAEVGDDGGLTLDEHPVGGHYDLVFSEGGCAHLVIRSVEQLSRASLYGDEDEEPVEGWYRYRARGWAEGYTVPDCNKVIEIDVIDGEIVELMLREHVSGRSTTDPDYLAHKNSPLWEPYCRWCEGHNDRVQGERRKLVWSYLGRTEIVVLG